MNEYTKPALPFAVFDEFGAGADDRVQDYADACVAAATEALRAELAELHEQLQAGDHIRAGLEAELAHIRAEQWELVAWISVGERLPKSGQTVLACYTNAAGMVRRIRAEWVAAKTIESDAESEIGEYDEATDAYYDPEGWYEKIDNWGEYSSVAVVEGAITHWMPLPAAPELVLGAADAHQHKDR
jgi:Protein of unknown function (DUF551)